MSSDYLPPTKVLFVFIGAVYRAESAWHPECTEEEALVLMKVVLDERVRKWLKVVPSLPVQSGGTLTHQTLKWQ